jgi:hypothetical protein
VTDPGPLVFLSDDEYPLVRLLDGRYVFIRAVGDKHEIVYNRWRGASHRSFEKAL